MVSNNEGRSFVGEAQSMEEVNDLILFRDWPHRRSDGGGRVVRGVFIVPWVVLRVVFWVVWVVVVVSTVIILGVRRIMIGFPVAVSLRIP